MMQNGPIIQQVALSALNTLFSLQILPSLLQMADAQEEQLNTQTLSTKAMRNTKKRTARYNSHI